MILYNKTIAKKELNKVKKDSKETAKSIQKEIKQVYKAGYLVVYTKSPFAATYLGPRKQAKFSHQLKILYPLIQCSIVEYTAATVGENL